jgi:hypothetical protein
LERAGGEDKQKKLFYISNWYNFASAENVVNILFFKPLLRFIKKDLKGKFSSHLSGLK